MLSPYRQDTRIGELFTPLGADKLVLMEFSGTEAVSELFQFHVTALCEQEPDQSLDFDAALGQTCSVRVTTAEHGERYFSGTLTEARRIGQVNGGVLYRLELRPWFWLLTQRVNSRIFHEHTVDEIIETVLGEYGFADHINNGGHPNSAIEYCVQHRESDHAFLCRLMEKYGIAYYFTYGKNTQTMVMSAKRSGFGDAPGKVRNFYPVSSGNHPREEHFHGWVSARRFNSGTVKLNDYNFKEPRANLVAEKSGGAGYSPSDLEIYSHPGEYTSQSEGEPFAEIAINAIQAQDNHCFAEGNCAGLSPGMIVELGKHHDAGEYLVLRVSHQLVSETFRSGGSGQDGAYFGQYELIGAERAYAPPQLTPRPFISGPQTGVVVTNPGEDPDGYGRIKVLFHWNRGSGRDETESMWCRVAHVWAGNEWGGQFIPRADMEVLVQFIDGDPDRPVVVGTVYNENNPHPFEEKDTSGWRTQTVDGGGFNELAFVDKDGAQLIRIIGEKDLKATLKNDVLIEADNKITLKVGASTIVIDQSSITLNAQQIKITAGVDLKTSSGATASHEAGAPMTIQAPLVKIN